MAILRSKEISEMSPEERDSHLSELRRDLMKINGILASGGIPEDVGRAREIKRTIARILTFKKISEKAEVEEKKPAKEAVKEKVSETKKENVVKKEKSEKEKPKLKTDTKRKVSKNKKNVSKK